MKTIIGLSLVAAALAAGTAQATTVTTSNTEIQREASEGPRGGDRERPGDRQRRGGRAIEDSNVPGIDGILMVREGRASGGGRQRQRHGGAEGGLIDDGSATSVDGLLLAREASEGPRGGDNERAGDRQRRRGRNG